LIAILIIYYALQVFLKSAKIIAGRKKQALGPHAARMPPVLHARFKVFYGPYIQDSSMF
jgi:hypothetical protein